MASQQKSLLLQLVVEAVDKASTRLSSITKEINQVASASKQAGKEASAIGSGAGIGSGLAGGVTAVSTAYLAVTQVVQQFANAYRAVMSVVETGIAKWSESIQATRELEIAWAGSGRQMPLEKMKAFNLELWENTSASQAGLNNATKYFAGIGQITDEMLPRVMKLATDVQAFTDQDMETVAMQLSRVFQGNYQALSRIGIRIPQVVAATGDLDQIIAALESRVGGMASVAMEGWSGKSKYIADTWNQIYKLIGDIAGSSLLNTLESWRLKIKEFYDWLKKTDEAGGFADLRKGISEAGAAFTRVAAYAVEAFKRIGKGLAEALTGKEGASFADGLMVAIKKIEAAAYFVINIIEGIGDKKAVFEALGQAVNQSLKPFFQMVAILEKLGLIRPVKIVEDDTTAQLMKTIEEVKELQKQADTLKEKSDKASASFPAMASNSFEAAALKFTALEDKFGAIKDQLDESGKAADTYYDSLNQIGELNLSKVKTEIEATYASEKLAAVAIASAETEQAAQKIANTQKVFQEKKKYAEQAHAVEMALIEKELKRAATDPSEMEKVLKQKAEKEKAYRDASLAEEKKLQDAIAEQVKAQNDKVASILKERKAIEQSMRDETAESQKAYLSIAQKSMSETDRLKTSYAQAVDDLKAANALLSTMPEKAAEMAKKARSELQGLTQDINALAKKLNDTFTDNQEKLRQMAKKGMSPSDQWLSDQKEVNRLLAEGQKAMEAGNLSQAEKLAGQAKNLALTLDKAPEGTPFTQDQMTNAALPLVTAAMQLEESAQKGGIEFAQNMNKGIREGVGKAGIVIKTAQEALLDANTKQLVVHGALLDVLARQYNVIIAQNNQLITLAGGKAQATQGQGQAASGPSDLTNKADMAGAVAAGVEQGITQASGTGSDQYGYNISPGGQQPDLSSLTRAEQSSSGYTDFLLAQTDQALAASKSESAMMDARQDALKYLESQAANLDRKEQAGYIKTEPGVLGKPQFGMSDSGLTAALQSLFGSSSVTSGTSIFDNLGSIIEGIQSGRGQGTSGIRDLEQQLKGQAAGVLGQLNGANPLQDMASQMKDTLSEAFSQLKEDLSGVGEVIAQTASAGIEQAYSSGNFNIDLQVSQDSDPEANITRY